MKKTKKKNFLISFFKNLDDFVVLLGLLTNFGIIVVSVVFLEGFLGVSGFEIQNIFLVLWIEYFIFSGAFFFSIRKIKSFNIGYIVGFILMTLVFGKHFL